MVLDVRGGVKDSSSCCAPDALIEAMQILLSLQLITHFYMNVVGDRSPTTSSGFEFPRAHRFDSRVIHGMRSALYHVNVCHGPIR